MRPVDYTSFIGRTNDISPIKQAEDAKPVVEQQSLIQINEKQLDIKQDQVYQKKDSDMDSEYDASKNGNGAQYEGGQKRRKKENEEDGKVTIKGHATFDIKI